MASMLRKRKFTILEATTNAACIAERFLAHAHPGSRLAKRKTHCVASIKVNPKQIAEQICTASAAGLY